MCMQCMAGAMSAVGSASGVRAWLGHRFGARISPVAMRRITVALFAAALLASGAVLKGSSPAAAHSAATAHTLAAR